MSREETLAKKIYNVLINRGEPMTVGEIYDELDVDKPRTTVRGRIYDNINKLFKRVAKGVYWVIGEDSSVMVVEGSGRDLSMIETGSVDAIVTDHPWFDPVAHKGGNRNFTSDYNCFRYTLEDFQEKARVLKEGSFLVEVLPSESATNYEYLYEIKQMAKKAGFEYYSKVPWKKGSFVANTGRKAKNTEDIMFFTKGKARSLKPNKKEILKGNENAVMSGASYMLPTVFDYNPPSKKERIHQAEKPVELYAAILEAITLPGEVVIDQYAGSGNLGNACLKKNRFGILFEILKDNCEKIIKNLGGSGKLVSSHHFEDTVIEDKFEVKEPEQIDIFSFA